MVKSFLIISALMTGIVFASISRAEDETDNDSKAETKSETKTEAKSSKVKEPKQFEIIDGTASVIGDPGGTSAQAREKWAKACSEWKSETKDLNKASESGKSNQVLSLSCGSADCAYQENGSYVCTSSAQYKLKIEGVRAPPPAPAPVVQKSESQPFVVTASPPQVIYEVTPAPQPGFIWIPGFWGWNTTRHVWYPGHWQAERPGFIWIGHQWSHHDRGWRFETGHWDRRH